jgi:hypothetical protein
LLDWQFAASRDKLVVMSQAIHAIYENGVFKPLAPVDLPDHTPVVVTPACVSNGGDGIRASAGAWAGDDAAIDEWLDQIARMRRRDRGLLTPGEIAP